MRYGWVLYAYVGKNTGMFVADSGRMSRFIAKARLYPTAAIAKSDKRFDETPRRVRLSRSGRAKEIVR